MKRILSVILTVLLVFGVAACSDAKTYDKSINVMFFTYSGSQSLVAPYTNLEAGQLIEEPESPTRPGFIFTGWYTDPKGSKAWNFETDRVGETSMMLYAGWYAGDLQIIYHVNDGVMPADYPTTFKPGQTRVLPLPTRVGYQFIAWYTYEWTGPGSTKPGDSGYQTVPASQTTDFEIHAHWKPVTVTTTFRTNFPIDGGPANPSSKTLNYGVIIDFPQFEDTLGYRFLGWNLKSDGTGQWFINGEIYTRTQRTTVYGIWEKI